MSLAVLDRYVGVGNGDPDERRWPCQSQDPDLFFADSVAGVEQAKQVCQECPVRAECLAGALERREPWGVWGGQLFFHGVVIPRKRPRGRPPKRPTAA